MEAMSFLRTLLLGSAAAALSLQVAGCGCTMVGCESGVDVTLFVTADAPLAGSELRICVNGACSTGAIVADGDQLVCELEGGHRCTIAPFEDVLSVEVHVWVNEDEAEDGDQILVTLSAPDDSVLAEQGGEVVYQESEPNGAMCGPTCMNATL
jgi:hypothetical protein